MLQIAVRGHLKAGDIFGQFFINVLQRGRNLHIGAHRKRQTVRLPFVVIWVLPQHHHFHLIEFGGFESIEHIVCRRVNDLPALTLCFDGVQNLPEIRLLLFLAQRFAPSIHCDIPFKQCALS